MRASEMICANPELTEQPRQVRTSPVGDADECGPETPTSPKGGERSARDRASSAADARLGLLVVVATGAVVYGTIAACIWRSL